MSVPTTPAHILTASPPSAPAVLFGRRLLQETIEIAEALAEDAQNGAENATVPVLIHADPLPRLVQPCTATSRLFGPCKGGWEAVPEIAQG